MPRDQVVPRWLIVRRGRERRMVAANRRVAQPTICPQPEDPTVCGCNEGETVTPFLVKHQQIWMRNGQISQTRLARIAFHLAIGGRN